MWEKIKTAVAASKSLQLVLTLLLGIVIGAMMYPTKRIEERLDKKHEEEISSLKESYEKIFQKEKEEYSKLAQESKEYHRVTESKVSSLTSEVSTLKSHQKTAYYKVVKPDGTIEERNFTEIDLDSSRSVIASIQQEFKEKVDSIEKKWEQVHKERVTVIKNEFVSKEAEYKKIIDELHSKKIVDVNKKSFGIEAGMLTNKDYYSHVTYDVLGPLFLGLHGQFGLTSAAGVGVGIRF